MSSLNYFKIPFVGLKNEIHEFSFIIDDSFFQLFENPTIKKGNYVANLEFDKKDSFFILNFKIDGTVEVRCDRCSDIFDYELMVDFEVIIKFKDRKSDDEEGDVMYIDRNDSSLNVAQLIYDYTMINLPLKITHPTEEDCNPEVIKQLNRTKEKELDPRWSSLEKLKNK